VIERLLPVGLHKLPPYGAADVADSCPDRGGELVRRRGKGREYGVGPAGEHSVRLAGDGVGVEHCGPHAASGSPADDRGGGESAKAQHGCGMQIGQHLPGLQGRRQVAADEPRRGGDTSRQGLDRLGDDGVGRRFEDVPVDRAVGAGEDDLGAWHQAHQFARHGQAGVDVPAGSASREDEDRL